MSLNQWPGNTKWDFPSSLINYPVNPSILSLLGHVGQTILSIPDGSYTLLIRILVHLIKRLEINRKETTTKKDKAERDTICGLTHLNRSQFLIPYQDLKKSDLHTHTGTCKLHPEQNHLCLVEYKHGITDYPGAGNSKKTVMGRWEKNPGINRNEEERRAGEHQDKNINLVRCLARIIYVINILD